MTARRPLAIATALAGLLAAHPGARGVRAEEEQPRDFAALHVLVAWAGAPASQATRTKEEAKARAEEVVAELAKPGADFAEVSRRFSEDKVSDAEGGFLGVFERGRMVPEFERAVEALPVGGTSGLVESPFGFHVIRRLSLEEGLEREARLTTSAHAAFFAWKGQTAPPGVRVPETSRTREEAQADAAKAAAAARSGTALTALPEALAAAPLGPGFLVTLRRGPTREGFGAFVDAVFALRPGETTDPVETPMGFVVATRLPHFRDRVRQVVVSHAEAQRRPRGVTRSRDEARARAQEALERLRADPSSWATVLAAYSDEIGGVERGGSIGVVGPGAALPPIEEALRRTPAGGFSEVVETPMGFHVLQRTP